MRHLLISTPLILFFSLSVYGQDTISEDTIRAIVSKRTVELIPRQRTETADFVTVSIKVEGRLVKQFATRSVIYPYVVATIHGIDNDFILYRTFMGQGACAGGDLYVIRLSDAYQTNLEVVVSPVLSGCLGEFQNISFTYDKEVHLQIAVGNSVLDGFYMSGWRSVKKSHKHEKTKVTEPCLAIMI